MFTGLISGVKGHTSAYFKIIPVLLFCGLLFCFGVVLHGKYAKYVVFFFFRLLSWKERVTIVTGAKLIYLFTKRT